MMQACALMWVLHSQFRTVTPVFIAHGMAHLGYSKGWASRRGREASPSITGVSLIYQ